MVQPQIPSNKGAREIFSTKIQEQQQQQQQQQQQLRPVLDLRCRR